mgnify:CR=1 FL=1
MTKWDKIFRIAVVLLLSANLAVSSMLGNVPPAVSSGENSSAAENADADVEPIPPESPKAVDAWYDYA